MSGPFREGRPCSLEQLCDWLRKHGQIDAEIADGYTLGSLIDDIEEIDAASFLDSLDRMD